MAYIPDTKSYHSCTTNDIAKRRGIYTSEVQDYLVEFSKENPEADIQTLAMSDDPEAIEEGTDVLLKTTFGSFILYPDGNFEVVENSDQVKKNRNLKDEGKSQAIKKGRNQNIYTKAIIDNLLSIGIGKNQIHRLKRTSYNLVRIDAYAISLFCKEHKLQTYGGDFAKAVRALEKEYQEKVIKPVSLAYNIQIDSGYYGELRAKHRDRQETPAETWAYLIFVPLAE